MRLPKRFQGKEWLLALTAGALGMLVTLVVAVYIHAKNWEKNHVDFLLASSRIEKEAQRRLEVSIRLLRGVQGLQAAKQGKAGQQDLHQYLAAQKLAEEYPGVVGVGFMRRVPAAQVEEYVAERKRIDPSFHLKARVPNPGDRYITELVEPYQAHRHAFGIDTASYLDRKAVADLAMLTGEAVFHGPIQYEEFPFSGTHFTLLLPYYRSGAAASTPEERERALEGWIFAPVQVEKMMHGLGGKGGHALGVVLYAGATKDEMALLFDSDGSQKGNTYQRNRERHAFSRDVPLRVGKQVFTLEISAEKSLLSDIQNSFPLFVLLTGGVISLLLAWSAWSMGRTRQMALVLAEKMSAAARDREAQLEAIFNNTAESIITVDQQGAIRSFNKAAQKLFGYSEEEILGCNASTLTVNPISFDEHRIRELIPESSQKLIEGQLIDHLGRQFVAEISIGECVAGGELFFVVLLRDISWRRQQEQERAMMQHRLALALDAADLGVWQWWPDTNYFSADDKTCALYGIAPDDLSRNFFNWVRYIHEDDKDFVLTSLSDALDQHGRRSLLFRVRLDNGALCYQQANMLVTEDGAGQKSMIGVIQDVTAQKLLEQSLRASEERFSLAAQAAQEGIWDWDLVSGKMWFSAQWKAMFGYLEHEFDNTLAMWEALILPEDRERCLQLIDAFIQGHSQRFEEVFRFLHKNGQIVFVRSRLVQLRNAADKAVRVVGTCADITDMLRQEADLRESRERISLTIDCARLGTWDWNLLTNDVIYGGKWGEMIGYSLDKTWQDLLSWQVLVHPDDYARTMAAYEAHWRGDTPYYSCEYRMKVKSGEWCWMQGVGRVVSYDDNGRPIRMLGVNIDISERKQNEMALLEAHRVAEDASRAKSEFLANMSHEIRTPLNAVLGFSALLAETTLNRRQTDFVDSIHTAGDALLTLINDLLDFSKIEAGHLELEAIDFDLGSILEDTIDIVAAKAAIKNIDLACFIAPTVPVCVNGDPARLRQIILNLLNNAVKFTEQGEVVARVSVADCAVSSLRLRVEIHDTGIGIAPEVQTRLFQSFTQADASTTRRFGGTGLGLSICRRLVEAMGGSLGVQSVPGAGSIFWFEIVLQRPPAYCELGMLPQQYLGARVLVVESSQLYRELLATRLESIGLLTVACQDTQAAHKILAADPDGFLLAILDSTRFEDEALAFARVLHESSHGNHLPLIRLTAMLASGPVCELQGAALFAASLNKPIHQSHFLHCVHIALQLHGKQQKIAMPLKRLGQFTQSTAHRPRILLAEDNPVNQKLAVLMLEDIGCEVDVAQNGRDAVAAHASQDFDLVLMDRQMPEMDGFSAAAAMRSLPGQRGATPIVALTANAFKVDVDRCFAAGMNDFVSKPFTRDALLRTLVRRLPDLVPDARMEVVAPPSADYSRKKEVTDELLEDLANIDLVFADIRKNLGLDMREELLALYFPTQIECLSLLETALTKKQGEIVQSVAHKLKGASIQLGAKSLAAHCQSLERAGRDGRLEDAVAAYPILKALAQALAERLHQPA